LFRNYAGIKALPDEFKFWDHARATGSIDGSLAESVFVALEPLKKWCSLESLSWLQAMETVEQGRDSLDGIWKAKGHKSQR